MTKFSGKSIYKGVAIGPVFVLQTDTKAVEQHTIENADEEVNRFESARQTAMQQLGDLYDKTLEEVDEESAAIFEVHQMLLDDEDFVGDVHEQIRQENVNAEFALSQVGNALVEQFKAMEDDYFRERAVDMKDITDRVMRSLKGETEIAVHEPSIIVADDLTPSETIRLGKDKILGFVTRQGSSSSHSAILARTMGIPALYQVDIQTDWHGDTAVIDGENGFILLDPTEEELQEYREKQAVQLEQKAKLRELVGQDNVTTDGKRVDLFANIGSVSDAELAISNDAGGIGLFRSEFLNLDQDRLPTEEEQFKAYKAVLETMAGKKVVIRTLDIGADKKADYLNLQEEQNPALGYRAIRICLSEPEIFRTQLRALFRAAVYGKLAIMFPMIISVNEILLAKEIVADVLKELDQEDTPYGEAELGIMIETPAAAVMADELAEEVDFFSIGTNDLTQYTLAIDRQNERLDPFLNKHHPAILRLIEWTIQSGHKAGIWVGICGELGADPELMESFLRMGVDELSVSPALVLPTRERIRKINLS